MLKNAFLQKNWDIITILMIYLFLSLILFRFFQYNIAGDEISYIDIARAYSAGHWENAINGYWSPLYSWLMVPFLFLIGFNPLYGVYISKLLSIVIGFFTILAIRRLGIIFNLEKTVLRIFLASLIIPIVLYALFYQTPDLLLVLILTLYLSLIYNPSYQTKLSYGILCGITGAFAYFTKSFAFPFFIVHFVLSNVLFYSKSIKIQKKIILKNLMLGLTIFFILSGLWIGTISTKYDKLTFSTAGEYNQALVGPDYKDNSFDHGISPIYSIGLIRPPNNDTTSIWGDLSYFPLNNWSPFDSWNNFKYELVLIISNVIYTFNIVESFMFVAIIILIAMIFMLISSKIDAKTKVRLKYILITIFIYVGGYCLIVPEWRYLWFIFVLLAISGFIIIDSLHKNQLITINIRNIFLIFLFCSFVFQPALELSHFANQKDVKYGISQNLELNYNVHGNFASDKWDGALTIAYYLNSKYYGGTKNTDNAILLNQELINNNIDYYYVWNKSKVKTLNNYYVIFNDTVDGLIVYKRIK